MAEAIIPEIQVLIAKKFLYVLSGSLKLLITVPLRLNGHKQGYLLLKIIFLETYLLCENQYFYYHMSDERLKL